MVILLLACSGPPDARPDTASPVDSDGDGWYDWQDCDPADVWTYPGAEEWCDAKDHDCDGDPLPPGVCDKPQVLEALDNRELPIDGEIHQITNLGDLDGDGIDELSILLPSFTLGFFEWPDADMPLLDALPHVLALDGGGNTTLGLDFDGDGEGDIVTVFQGSSAYRGNAWVIQGPLDRLPAESTVTTEASIGWEEAEYRSNFGYQVGVGDFDADGRDDVLVSAGLGVEGTAYLLAGRDGAPGLTDLSGETANTGPFDFQSTAVGDLDGDGFDDIVSDGHDGTWRLLYYSGAAITPGTREDWSASAHRVDSTACSMVRLTDEASIGDWSGDGVPDLTVSCSDSDGVTHTTFVDGARFTAYQTLEESVIGDWALEYTDWGLTGSLSAVPSMDGDELTDFLYVRVTDHVSYNPEVHPFLSVDGAPGPGTPLTWRSWSLRSDEAHPAPALGIHVLPGEFDGNPGWDLFVTAYPRVGSRPYVIPGWGMDWDDPP